MAGRGQHEPYFGLQPQDLQPNEVVLHHWSSRDGRLLLTNQRLLLLGHPAPVHRKVLSSQALEDVKSLEVVDAAPQYVDQFRMDNRYVGKGGTWSPLGGIVYQKRLAPDCYVKVNGAIVYKGFPITCEDIQKRVDAAREKRMMATLGRSVPYE